MINRILTALIVLILFNINSIADNQLKYINYVNPFIGTGGHGHTYPGATTPFGLVQLSPDTGLEGWDWASGYHYSDSSIIGFSHTHLSGTGNGDFADILIMPTIGKINFNAGTKENPDAGYRSRFSHSKETAKPGYYCVHLSDYKIDAELTATPHCGMHRYTFNSKDEANIVVDLQHGLYSYVMKAKLIVEDNQTIVGYRYSGGWAHLQPVYFVIRFSKPFKKFGTANNNNLIWNIEDVRNGHNSEANIKGIFSFDVVPGDKIIIKVGISTTSIENARINLDSQIAGYDFDAVKNHTQQVWEQELSKIEVEGSIKDKEVFYTSLYHSFITPNNIADVDGSYFGPDQRISKSPTKKFYSTFSLWDTYRATHPLYTIIQPQRTGEMIHSMLLHYQKWGHLPIWVLWGQEAGNMIGNHAIPVIVDAFDKKIKGFDYQLAYEAIKKTATLNKVESPFDIINKLGYLPNDFDQCVSKTLEIAYDDWCVAQMAKNLGFKQDYEFFLKRSNNFKSLFDSSTGFMRGKNWSGEWTIPFDPQALSRPGDYTEGNAFQYSWYVPHAPNELINMFGGVKPFSKKLDELFETAYSGKEKINDVSGFIGQYAHGNEPSHHIAYFYNLTNEHWKTQKYIRKICDELYNNTPDGLAGNEDCGQMSSWYVFSSLGFYPVNPADGLYWIGTPTFKSATIHTSATSKFVVVAKNLSKQNIYVKRLKLNGKVLNGLIIKHDDIIQGGVLEFEMTDKIKNLR
jgi:predicted alpha-1,2-mannosidase